MTHPSCLRLVMLTGDGRQCVVYQGLLPIAAFNVQRELDPVLLERLRLAAHTGHPRKPLGHQTQQASVAGT